jgi:ATP-dependent protease Clp ATPase subunit
MSNQVKRKVKHEQKKVTLSFWDDAITDVGRQTEETEERLRGLKSVVKTFQSLKDSG